LVLCDAFVVADNGSAICVITDPRFENVIRKIGTTRPIEGDEYGTPEREARFKTAALQQRPTNTEVGYWIAASNPDAAHHAITGNSRFAMKTALAGLPCSPMAPHEQQTSSVCSPGRSCLT